MAHIKTARLVVQATDIACRANVVRQAEASLTAARAVRPVVERVWVNALGPTADASLRAAGQKVAADPFARRQLAGHLFEQLDTQRYNLRHLADPEAARHVLQLCEDPLARGYDAFRFIGGRFSGGVQHKLCVANIRPGVGRLDALTPGSGSLATFRMPSDVADQTTLNAGNLCRVQASELSRADVYRELDRGADQLARHGSRATSRAFQTTKAGAKGAGVAVVIGGLLDSRKLRRGEMSGKHFLARRGVDTVEGAATTVATSGAVVATTSVATAIAAAGGTGAATATAVLTAPAWAVPVAAGVVVGIGVRFVTKRLRRRIDAHFTDGTMSPADSVLVEDLDTYRPRPWVPAAAAAMLVVPTVNLWTPNPLAFLRP